MAPHKPPPGSWTGMKRSPDLGREHTDADMSPRGEGSST